jgi:hypothetical protein
MIPSASLWEANMGNGFDRQGFDRQSWAVVLLGWVVALWATLG